LIFVRGGLLNRIKLNILSRSFCFSARLWNRIAPFPRLANEMQAKKPDGFLNLIGKAVYPYEEELRQKINLAALLPIVTRVMKETKATSPPYIVGIDGASGAGKTFLAKTLKALFETREKKVLILELDDFLKSPGIRRGLSIAYGESEHVDLVEASSVLQKIKNREPETSKSKYNRVTKRIETETIDTSKVEIVIVEGCYAISNIGRLGNFLRFVNLGIYVHTRENQRKRWKMEQEMEKPHPRNKREFEHNWRAGTNDLIFNIRFSRENANFVVRMGPGHIYNI